MKPNLVFLKQNVNENVSADKISISIKDCPKSLYKSLFKLAGITPKDQNPDTTKRFCFGNKLLIQGKKLLLKRTKEGKELYLNLLQPTTYIQEFLNPVFKKHHVIPIPSCFELTTDFYTKNREKAVILQDEMIQHIIQTYQHGYCHIVVGKDGSITFYTQDIRGKKKSRKSKFAKIYIRPFDNQSSSKGINDNPFVRLEITLNRPILERLEWQYPITLNQILNLDIMKLIKFVDFNHFKFVSYLDKPERTNLKRRIEYHLNKTGKSLKNLNEYPVYEIIEILKTVGIKNYNRFIENKPENLLLQESLKKLKGYDMMRIKKRKKLKDKLADESSSTPSYAHKQTTQRKDTTMNDKLLILVRKNIISINKDIQKKQGKIGSHKMIALARLLSVYTKMQKMDKEEKKIVPQQGYYEQIEKGLVKMKD
jgi:hypothetical protein